VKREPDREIEVEQPMKLFQNRTISPCDRSLCGQVTAALLTGWLMVLLVTVAGAQQSPDGEVGIGRLHYSGGGDWYSDASSLPNLLREFQRRTGIPCGEQETVLRATDPVLDRTPFVYVTGHGNLRFSREEESRIRHWLERGGFLWADDNYGLDESFRFAIARMFPGHNLQLVPRDHPIYNCFYQLDGVPKIHEHDGKPPQGWGLFLDGRLVLFYTYEADIGDGLEDPAVHKDPPVKREAAIKMAVNILYYALTRSG
jgi:hypothetical protein